MQRDKIKKVMDACYLAKRVRDLLPKLPNGVTSTHIHYLDTIRKLELKTTNIKVSDIVSDKRSNNVAYPRQIAMYLCREVANMSFPSIGKDFGGRDHSTVLHAYSKIKDEYETKSETKDLIEDIKKALSIAD